MKPVDILLVEDNPGDVVLTRQSMAACKLNNELHVVNDGEQALAFLRREAPYEGSPRPDLVLLDLNLPRTDGREVLSQMKETETLRRIPVVVLTSSDAETDVVRAYELHANAYVTKPLDLGRFHEVVQAIDSFWFSVVTYPPRL